MFQSCRNKSTTSEISFTRKKLVIAGQWVCIWTSGSIVHDSLGQYDKAMEYYTQALAIFEDIKSPYAELVRERIAELEAEKE